jgi:hypothetical protein
VLVNYLDCCVLRDDVAGSWVQTLLLGLLDYCSRELDWRITTIYVVYTVLLICYRVYIYDEYIYIPLPFFLSTQLEATTDEHCLFSWSSLYKSTYKYIHHHVNILCTSMY